MNDINAIIDVKVEAAVAEVFNKGAFGLNRLDSAMYARCAEQAKSISELDKAVDARLSELAKSISELDKAVDARLSELAKNVETMEALRRGSVNAINNLLDRVQCIEEGTSKSTPPSEDEVRDLLQTLGQVVLPSMEDLAAGVIKTRQFRQTLQRQIDLALDDLDVTQLLSGARMTVTFEAIPDDE